MLFQERLNKALHTARRERAITFPDVLKRLSKNKQAKSYMLLACLFFNGVYTQRFNRIYGHDGQLFRGRYKSILVGEDSYLLQLV